MSLLKNDMNRISRYAFQKVYQFECVMPPVGIADAVKVSELVTKVNYSDYEMSNPEGMRFGAFQSFYSNFLTKTPFSIEFKETEFGDVRRYFRGWRNLIIDSKGRYKRKKGFTFGYAKPIFVNYLDSDGKILAVVRFKYAFPIVYNLGTLDYDRSDVQKLEIKFVCDRIEDAREYLVSPVEDIIERKVGPILRNINERF